jgi:hypothetical protein
MWCAVKVASDDGRSLWLTGADAQGVRSVDEFKCAAIFWRREHAQAAIQIFLSRDGQSSSQVTIVDISQDIFRESEDP